MLEGALYEEEAPADDDSESAVSEVPWGATWGVCCQQQPEWDEEGELWSWLLTAEVGAGEGLEPDSPSKGVGLPGLRPTGLVRADGERFRVPGGGLYSAPGWRSKMVPCRTVDWGYPVDGEAGAPVTPLVRLDGPTLLSPAGREFSLPNASLYDRPLGDLSDSLPSSTSAHVKSAAMGARSGQGRSRPSLRGSRTEVGDSDVSSTAGNSRPIGSMPGAGLGRQRSTTAAGSTDPSGDKLAAAQAAPKAAMAGDAVLQGKLSRLSERLEVVLRQQVPGMRVIGPVTDSMLGQSVHHWGQGSGTVLRHPDL